MYIIRTLKVVLNWAVDMHLISKNPAANIKVTIKSTGSEMKVWTDEQVKYFLMTARESKILSGFLLSCCNRYEAWGIVGIEMVGYRSGSRGFSIRRILQHSSEGLKLYEQTKTARVDDLSIFLLPQWRF